MTDKDKSTCDCGCLASTKKDERPKGKKPKK